MARDGTCLYAWHVDRFLFPNERLAPALHRGVAHIRRHDSGWQLVNDDLRDMTDIRTGQAIGLDEAVALDDGSQILLSRANGGRLIHVQVADGTGAT